jgi:hypothetical protein
MRLSHIQYELIYERDKREEKGQEREYNQNKKESLFITKVTSHKSDIAEERQVTRLTSYNGDTVQG